MKSEFGKTAITLFGHLFTAEGLLAIGWGDIKLCLCEAC